MMSRIERASYLAAIAVLLAAALMMHRGNTEYRTGLERQSASPAAPPLAGGQGGAP